MVVSYVARWINFRRCYARQVRLDESQYFDRIFRDVVFGIEIGQGNTCYCYSCHWIHLLFSSVGNEVKGQKSRVRKHPVQAHRGAELLSKGGTGSYLRFNLKGPLMGPTCLLKSKREKDGPKLYTHNQSDKKIETERGVVFFWLVWLYHLLQPG